MNGIAASCFTLSRLTFFFFFIFFSLPDVSRLVKSEDWFKPPIVQGNSLSGVMCQEACALLEKNCLSRRYRFYGKQPGLTRRHRLLPLEVVQKNPAADDVGHAA